MQLLQSIQYNSPVVLTFALVSFAALVLNWCTHGQSNRMLFSVGRASPRDPLTYVRLFTHVLGHKTLGHYVSNMMLFLLLGPAVEERYGSILLLFMIAITALITGVVHILLSSRTVLLGASGLVFMLIPLSSLMNYEQGVIPLTFLLVVAMYLGKEIVDAVSSSDNISQLTHIIGVLLGIFFALTFHV